MSKYQFKLPDIGEGIAEGTIGEWHVKPGDKVEVDGDLVQIEMINQLKKFLLQFQVQ